jgi:hypothetical protein
MYVSIVTIRRNRFVLEHVPCTNENKMHIENKSSEEYWWVNEWIHLFLSTSYMKCCNHSIWRIFEFMIIKEDTGRKLKRISDLDKSFSLLALYDLIFIFTSVGSYYIIVVIEWCRKNRRVNGRSYWFQSEIHCNVQLWLICNTHTMSSQM